MARKRASDPPPAAKPQQPRSDDGNKMDNLKTLNQLLLKETMEKRFQIDQLKSHIGDIEESRPFASDIEREVSRIVVASAMAEEAKKVGSLQDTLGNLIRENDEMRKELGSVVKERDLMKNDIGKLEMANAEMRERLGLVVEEREEVDRLLRKKEEVFDVLEEMVGELENEMDEMSIAHKEEVEGLRANLEANVARMLELDDEGRRLLDVNRRLEVERWESNELFGMAVREMNDLRSKVNKLEQRNGKAVGELDRLRADVLVMEKEKEAMEMEFEAEARALELKVAELGENVGEISREKDGVEMVRARQEAEILELKKEIEQLGLNVVELERLCADYGEKNAMLVEENGAMMKELATLEEETREKEKGLEAKVGELSMKLDDLCANMRAISLEKDGVENARAKQDVDIARLTKEVEMLGLNVSELEEKCGWYGNRSDQLQDERDAVERELGVQRDESSRLRLQVEELKKSGDEGLKELKQLNASLDAVLSEKNEGERCIESLTKEKVALQDSLSAAKESYELLTKKMRAAKVMSEKVLSLLKSTAEAMNEPEMAQQNGDIDDDEIHPFVMELESIKCAFKSNFVMIEEMSREIGVLQADLENAKKKKMPSLLMCLYPAATLAAILVAYAARCR